MAGKMCVLSFLYMELSMKLKSLEKSCKCDNLLEIIKDSYIRYRKSSKNETQKVEGYQNQF